MKPMPNFIFPLILGAFTALTYVILVIVYTVQPNPFIDEIFHITQAQKYCEGKFQEWDSKITTLPGLYLFSIGILGPISFVSGISFCDVICLRLTNLVGTVFTFSTLYKLLNYLHGSKIDNWKLLLASLNLSWFPVLYWFTFLYYTDVLATMMVLIMMLLHVHKAPNFAATIGAIAVLMRQTNIVWVGFLASLLGIDSLGFHVFRHSIYSVDDIRRLFRKLRRIIGKPVECSELISNVIVDLGMYLVVLASFIFFVNYNGGIVVGDRDSHKPTLHLMQLCYFAAFFIVFTPFRSVDFVRPYVTYCKKHPRIVVAAHFICVLLVQNNTLVHPFLLADNRHYTFYIWNRFYAKWAIFKYLMIPFYIFGAFIIKKFIERNSVWFQVFYTLSTAMCLVPQRLLEPRYFILPFLVARMQNISYKWRDLCLECLYYVLINISVIFIFLYKEFDWPDLEEPQRIIW